jgi:hypothetical protein
MKALHYDQLWGFRWLLVARGQLAFVAADDALQKLARFGHDIAEAVEIEEHVEEFLSFEVLDRVSEVATFPQCCHQVLPCLGSTLEGVAVEVRS